MNVESWTIEVPSHGPSVYLERLPYPVLILIRLSGISGFRARYKITVHTMLQCKLGRLGQIVWQAMSDSKNDA